MGSAQEMTEYERQRLENIKRNAEVLASLNVHARLSDLSATSKRQRVEEKSYKSSEKKAKQKPEAPVVIRRSLRTQGKAPDSNGLSDCTIDIMSTPSGGKAKKFANGVQAHPVVEGPISFKDAYDGDGSYRVIVEKFARLMKNCELDSPNGEGQHMPRNRANDASDSIGNVKREQLEEPRDLKSDSENIMKSKLQGEHGERGPRTRSCANCVSRSSLKVETAKSEESAGLEGEHSRGPRTRSRANCVSRSSLKVERSKSEESAGLEGENIEEKLRTISYANGFSTSFLKSERVKSDEPIDLKPFKLQSENIARVVPGRILTVRFFPTTHMTMLVAGNKFGHVSFWDVKSQIESEEDDVIHLYQPHTAPVSGFSMHPFSLSKMYTSSYDGFLRLMNIEREQFDLAYSSTTKSALFSLSQRSSDPYSIYLGEGQGDLNVIDARVRGITNSWSLHDSRINTIDFNPANQNIMATSSSDGSFHLWDLRKIDVEHPRTAALHSVYHDRTVYSAYFSPSGNSLASTSGDNTIGLLCGKNFEDKFMIPHDNWVNRWVSSFRAIWGWDDTHLFVGNMRRRVDVVSVDQRKTAYTLESPLMTAIPCRYDAHPCRVGMLAGATSGGQVYIWTASL